MPGATGDELTYSTEKDGVSVSWTSAQGGGTATHTWEIAQGANTTVVVGTLDFGDPATPTWDGTQDGNPASGVCLFFEQDVDTVACVLLDQAGATLVYFDMGPKIVEAMVPEFENGTELVERVRCVCWPPRTGNGACNPPGDCDNSISCNPLGSICMWRNMHMVEAA